MAALSESKSTFAMESGGAITEGLGGIAVIVLAILSLVNVFPVVLISISGIVFGAALIAEGAAVASRYGAITRQSGDAAPVALGGGLTIELAVGAAAVVLGILALIGIYPEILMACLVIAGGAGLILSAGVVHRVNRMNPTTMGGPTVMQGAAESAAAAQVLAGIGAGTLGIVALTGVGRGFGGDVLTEVGMLVLGASLTLTGMALSGRMISLFSRGG